MHDGGPPVAAGARLLRAAGVAGARICLPSRRGPEFNAGGPRRSRTARSRRPHAASQGRSPGPPLLAAAGIETPDAGQAPARASLAGLPISNSSPTQAEPPSRGGLSHQTQSRGAARGSSSWERDTGHRPGSGSGQRSRSPYLKLYLRVAGSPRGRGRRAGGSWPGERDTGRRPAWKRGAGTPNRNLGNGD